MFLTRTSACPETVLARRDYRLAAARNGHRTEAHRHVRLRQVGQALADKQRRRLETEDDKRELAARKVDILGRGRMSEQVDDLAGRHLLGIEQVVDAHVYEHLLVVRFEVLVVVDTGYRLLGAQLLGHDGGKHVVVLDMVYGDEEVALAHGGLAQYGKCRGVTLDRDYVGKAADVGKEFGV